MQDSADLYDESVSSTMKSAQGRWLNSNPAHQNVLKQQSNEDSTEAQSESDLENHALSNYKPFGSIESEIALLKQSKLEDGALSDNKLSGSMETEDDSLKQSKLGGGLQPDNKLSGSLESDDASLKQSELDSKLPSSLERKDDSLKLGGGTQPDNKQSSSLESDNVSLKKGNLEAGQPTANKSLHSGSDSVPSEHIYMKKVTPKGKYFTGRDNTQTSV